ncbi:MAG: XkdX family protein [Oscillospiraceae bacterium]
MFEFIKLQYILGKITKAQVQGFVPKFISAEQAVEIIGGK